MCRLFHSLINISIGKTVAEHYVSHSTVRRFFQGNYLRERSGALHKQAIMSYIAIFNVKNGPRAGVQYSPGKTSSDLVGPTRYVYAHISFANALPLMVIAQMPSHRRQGP